MQKITGIVLSGGKSSRMGSEKGLCLLHNKPLVEYAIDVLKKICDPIIIGANLEDYLEFGLPVIRDEIKDIGPIAGIYSCLKTSKSEHNFVLSCDMPLISQELVQYIVSMAKGYDAVIPMFNGFPEPLCAYYNSSSIKKFATSIEKGIYKIQITAKALNTNFLTIDTSLPFYHKDMFLNVNALKELNQVEAILKNSLEK